MRPTKPVKFSFISFIKYNYGQIASDNMKEWMNCEKALLSAKQRLSFLIKCRKYDILPKHISSVISRDFTTYSNKCRLSLNNILLKLKFRLLNLEIRDLHVHLRFCTKKLRTIELAIKTSIPFHIYVQFFHTQFKALNKFSSLEKIRLQNKWLKLYNNIHFNSNMNTNRNMCGLHSQKSNVEPSNGNSVHSINNYDVYNNNNDISNVSINMPKDFPIDNLCSGSNDINPKWIINLSNIVVPDNISKLLQMGSKFSIDFTNRKKNVIFSFVKELEHKIDLIPSSDRDFVRNKVSGILNAFTNNNRHIKRSTIIDNKSVKTASKFIRDNNLLVTRSDKGNTTVILDRNIYDKKVNEMLNDKNTYSVINKSPGNILKNKVNTILKRWKHNEYINNSCFYWLNPTSNILPAAYALPKIHKKDLPFRLIVSSLGSPCHKISRFMHNILYNNLPKGDSFIKNSFELIDKVHDLSIPPNYKLISLDVVSLFTNIPKELVLIAIKNRWNFLKERTKIPLDDFIRTIEFLLDSTYFVFNNVVYRQLFGSPMGSPMSPVLADIVLQDLETKALAELRSLNCIPLFYVRYVDDILLCIPDNFIDITVDKFNSFDTHLQFTCEIENNRSINFLDVCIINDNGLITHNWYFKPTFSERFLNYNSNHPRAQKLGVVMNLFDRVIRLSDERFLMDNLLLVKNILLKNSYPLSWIKEAMNKKLRAKHFVNTPNENKPTLDLSRIMVFPYITNISEGIKAIIKEYNVTVLFIPINKLDVIIKTGKDKSNKYEAQDVVYKINCKDCDQTYIGQTKRALKTRIKEHKDNIKTTNLNVISNHRLDLEHDFNWDNVHTLDNEPIYKKRLVSEMLHIASCSNTLNIQSDTYNLNSCYDTLVKNTKKLK